MGRLKGEGDIAPLAKEMDELKGRLKEAEERATAWKRVCKSVSWKSPISPIRPCPRASAAANPELRRVGEPLTV